MIHKQIVHPDCTELNKLLLHFSSVTATLMWSKSWCQIYIYIFSRKLQELNIRVRNRLGWVHMVLVEMRVLEVEAHLVSGMFVKRQIHQPCT